MSRLMASRPVTITALGIAQILGWGTSFYFPAVLAPPIVADTGWSFGWVVSGTSIGLLVAGLIAPRVGTIIDRRGGRPVLAVSSLLYAAGLAGIGLAPNLPVYLAGWVVLGGGMGTGLYDAVFAALGKLYGKDARTPITNLTLFGGFASTVCWPLSALLAETFGWRGACLIYAAMHLAISLPLQMAVMPPLASPAARGSRPSRARTMRRTRRRRARAADLRAARAHPDRLGRHRLDRGRASPDLPAGEGRRPCAGGHARHAVRPLAGRRALRRAAVRGALPSDLDDGGVLRADAGGLRCCSADSRALALTILLYGAGYGIMWIARGTLPLALFGPDRYATLMGRLAFPSLIVQALSPAAGAWLIERSGVDVTMAVLTGFAAINVALIAVLWALCRHLNVRASCEAWLSPPSPIWRLRSGSAGKTARACCRSDRRLPGCGPAPPAS